MSPAEAELELIGRLTAASNATFLGRLEGLQVIYKPIAGERPLWDFPDGTLADRERAAYLVSQALGWNVVPRTWLGDGPFGPGMVQQWCEPDVAQEAIGLVPSEDGVPEGMFGVFEGLGSDGRDVTVVHEDTPALRRVAVFDLVVNNADRKGGHVLEMPDGHRYGVDHGLTFHAEPKLRTVLWGWAGRDFTADEVAGVQRVQESLGGGLGEALSELLTDAEVDALADRCARLATVSRFPTPRMEGPAIPWPPF